MRIPSQFNDESLYRGGKRSSSASGPSYRRLFRLFVALVLVVLVMREAAKPGVYETFFGDPLPDNLNLAGAANADSEDRFAPPGDVESAGRSREPMDQTELDRRISRVVDGSVWRSEDADALYYMLGTAQDIDPSDAARVAIVPLLQQPDVYRGQGIRLRGNVMRSEPVVAAENEFGIAKYWNLWIRPDDGGDRPLLAVVEDVGSRIEAIGQGDDPAIEPVQVHVVGRFLKRLAYRSSIGADLAPVIVGIAVVADEQTSRIQNVEEQPAVTQTRMVLGIVLSCVIGLALAGIAMWRTAVSARHARSLRQKGSDRSVAFLQRLDEAGDSETDQGKTR